MNYIPQVAKMLGVEVGERFKICDNGADYSFGDEGLRFGNSKADCDTTLRRLLTGREKIIKLPWKPKEGDFYYFPYINAGYAYADRTVWSDCCEVDMTRNKAGLVCRTEEEAIEKAKKMLEAVKDVYV